MKAMLNINIKENRKYWYAVMRDRNDDDWGTGSEDLNEAVKMIKSHGYGPEAYIAVIDVTTDDPVCVDEIKQSDF